MIGVTMEDCVAEPLAHLFASHAGICTRGVAHLERVDSHCRGSE